MFNIAWLSLLSQQTQVLTIKFIFLINVFIQEKSLFFFTFVSELSPYKEFLDERRWDRLIEQFRHEYYRLFHMSNQSVFTVTLEAGLSALKTPYPLMPIFCLAFVVLSFLSICRHLFSPF